jgi:hypothetical protein
MIEEAATKVLYHIVTGATNLVWLDFQYKKQPMVLLSLAKYVLLWSFLEILVS